MPRKNHLGVIGLSVMGSNLAMNLADQGSLISVYNRSPEKAHKLAKNYHGGGKILPYESLKDFVESLEIPRKIILMVKAGEAVDQIISQLKPFLEKGDVIIDGGNSLFKDSIRREQSLRENEIRFVGMGISGGEEGARKGPSLMPGGTAESYTLLSPILEKIAASDFSGQPCVTHIGENGAGHYVKMVHNGIEYADMELIAETYWILKTGLGMNSREISETFKKWNTGKLNSYLVEITGKILETKGPDGSSIVESILDSAGSKGTGKWASEEFLDLGVPGLSLTSSVFSRYASAHKQLRILLSNTFKGSQRKLDIPIETIEKALFAGKILSYAEGFLLLTEAQRVHGWHFKFSEIARIWQGGCIIRAALLRDITAAYRSDPNEPFLSLRFVQENLKENLSALREIVSESVRNGIPVPTFSATLAFFDTMTAETLPANLIQAQRDYFGAHGFQREIDGALEHFKWEDA